MKLIATALLGLLLFQTMVIAQNPERRKASNQARAASRSVSRLVANGGGALLRQEFDAQSLPGRFGDWLKANQDAIWGAGPTPFDKPAKWGVATTRGSKLYLHVMAWPKENKLLIPRLHNSVKSARLKGHADELKLKPNVKDWELTLPEKPKRRESILPIVELMLDGPAQPARATPPTVKPADSGALELHSRYAIVHGEMLRFEPQPHKNTVGYWVKEKDWAEWACAPAKAGTYEVELRYGCGNGQGGSDIELTVGSQAIPFQVEATGGFQAWRNVSLGTVELTKSTTKVTVRPKKKAKNAVMDIQQITLRPVK